MKKSTPVPDSESHPSLDFSDPSPKPLTKHMRRKLFGMKTDPKHFARKYPVEYDRNTRLWQIWQGIRRRCYKTYDRAYNRYGGRGITVCDEWRNDYLSFLKWALSNGYCPDLSLDRQNNDLHYSPDNCHWATSIEQANNTRTNHYLTAWGETKTLAEWTRDPRCVVSRGALRKRISNGQSPENAISALQKRPSVNRSR